MFPFCLHHLTPYSQLLAQMQATQHALLPPDELWQHFYSLKGRASLPTKMKFGAIL
jgi:hypothetical protein